MGQWRVVVTSLRLAFRGTVSGFFHSLDQVLHLHLLICGDDRFVGHGDDRLGDALDTFKCRPHFFGTADASGHTGDLQVNRLGLLAFRFDLGCSGLVDAWAFCGSGGDG